MFSQELAEFRRKPLPDFDKLRELKAGYRQHPIDLSDPRSEEPYVDIRDYGIAGKNHYFGPDNPPYWVHVEGSIPQLYMREGVLKTLSSVNERLKRDGLEFYVFDAYRPQAVQTYFHDKWMAERLRQYHPDWNPAKILEETEKVWARGFATDDLINPNSPPPHSTGAAVDLSLRLRRSGLLLEMACMFDDVDVDQKGDRACYPDYFEKRLKRGESLTLTETEALENRRMLFWVITDLSNLLTGKSLTTNPTEYWHISYGDQMWAKLTNQKAAFYSNIHLAESLGGPSF